MAVNVYECMLILNSNRYSRKPAEVSGEIAQFVEKRDGEMLVSRLWEERRLAYPINGHRKGTYWLAYFKLASDQVNGLERDCQLSENILRNLVIKIDPRIADALISHVQTAQVSEPEAAATVPEGKSESKESEDRTADKSPAAESAEQPAG